MIYDLFLFVFDFTFHFITYSINILFFMVYFLTTSQPSPSSWPSETVNLLVACCKLSICCLLSFTSFFSSSSSSSSSPSTFKTLKWDFCGFCGWFCCSSFLTSFLLPLDLETLRDGKLWPLFQSKSGSVDFYHCWNQFY